MLALVGSAGVAAVIGTWAAGAAAAAVVIAAATVAVLAVIRRRHGRQAPAIVHIEDSRAHHDGEEARQ